MESEDPSRGCQPVSLREVCEMDYRKTELHVNVRVSVWVKGTEIIQWNRTKNTGAHLTHTARYRSSGSKEHTTME